MGCHLLLLCLAGGAGKGERSPSELVAELGSGPSCPQEWSRVSYPPSTVSCSVITCFSGGHVLMVSMDL